MLYLFDGHEFLAGFGPADNERFRDANEDVSWISSCKTDMNQATPLLSVCDNLRSE